MWIHLRLTVSTQLIDSFEGFLKQQCSKYICVFEISKEGVEHYHLHFMYMKTMSAFRQAMQKQFTELQKVGNGTYSMAATTDEPAHDAYVCKGADKNTLPVIKYNSSLKYTQEYVKQSHEAFWLKNAEIRQVSTKRTKSETFLEYVLKQEAITSLDVTQDMSRLRKHIFLCVMKCLGQKAKILDECIVRRMVNGVLNVIIPHRFSEWMYERCFDSCERFDY